MTNVLVGSTIGTGLLPLPIDQVILTTISICFFYMAGTILNDVIDYQYDKMHRQDRPLVIGKISISQARLLVFLYFTIGLFLLYIVNSKAIWSGIFLIIMIVLYDLLHKKYAFTILIMGACRALVYITAALAFYSDGLTNQSQTQLIIISLFIIAYIAGITLIARKEIDGKPGKRKWLFILFPFAIILTIILIPPGNIAWTLWSLILLFLWFAKACQHMFTSPPNIPQAITTWLSAICLIDMLFLSLLNQPFLVCLAFGCFVITVISHKYIPGT